MFSLANWLIVKQYFLDGQMRYVVSTDAIGMGLNLPIRRVIFLETEKFDGTEQRPLLASEIRQIAGRAGRFGMYDRGYVGATENPGAIRAAMNAEIPPVSHAVVGFSDLVLQVDFDLLEVLAEWNRMPTVPPFVKLDISRYLSLISAMRERGFLLTKEEELRCANIPFDETDEALRELFFHFLRQRQQGEPPEQPGLRGIAGTGADRDMESGVETGAPATLPELELYYRKLDLYFSFARTFGYAIDEDKLEATRARVAEEINEILLHNLRNNIRFCAQCGKPLPLHHHGRLCDACFTKRRQRQGRG